MYRLCYLIIIDNPLSATNFNAYNVKYLDFTSSYTQAQHITGTNPFTCWDVEGGLTVTTNNTVTKVV